MLFAACNTVTTADDEASAAKKAAEEDTLATGSQNPGTDTLHTSQNSLDWNGAYAGYLDLKGNRERITVTLNDDNTWKAELCAYIFQVYRNIFPPSLFRISCRY